MHQYNVLYLANNGAGSLTINQDRFTSSNATVPEVALELLRIGAVLNPASGKWFTASAVIEIEKLS